MSTFKIEITPLAEIGFNRSGVAFVADVTKLPIDILARLVEHGIIQKVGDAAAGKAEAEAKTAMQAVWDRLCDGEWTGRVASAADPHARIRKYIRAILRRNLSASTPYKNAENKAEWLDAQFDAQADNVQATILKRAEKMHAEEHGGLEGIEIAAMPDADDVTE